MYHIGDQVQIYNHSEPQCNGEYGTVTAVEYSYSGVVYYTVRLETGYAGCLCTEDELMEG